MDGSVKRNLVLDHQLVSKFAFPQPPNSSEKCLMLFSCSGFDKDLKPFVLSVLLHYPGTHPESEKIYFSLPQKSIK